MLKVLFAAVPLCVCVFFHSNKCVRGSFIGYMLYTMHYIIVSVCVLFLFWCTFWFDYTYGWSIQEVKEIERMWSLAYFFLFEWNERSQPDKWESYNIAMGFLSEYLQQCCIVIEGFHIKWNLWPYGSISNIRPSISIVILHASS